MNKLKFFWNYEFSNSLKIILSIVMLLLFAVSLTRPYVDHDVLMYAEIGRAIFDRGLLPYEFAFDHKPLAAYYLYGLIQSIFPLKAPVFQCVSAGMLLATAALLRNLGQKESLAFYFLVLTAMSYPLLHFSGNTEIFYTFFSLLSFLTLFKARRVLLYFAAGGAAAIAFNINYLSVFLIGPPAVYLMLAGSSDVMDCAKKCGFYSAGFVGGFVCLFIPYLIKNPALVGDYFSAQAAFLDAYGKSHRDLPWYFVVKLAPMPILAVISMKCKSDDARLRTALIIMMTSALVGVLSSGKYYMHYGYIMVPSALALVALSVNPGRWLALLASLALLVLPSGRTALAEVGSPAVWRQAYDFSKYREIKTLVGEEKVLSIRASHVPVFYSNLNAAQPYIWVDHAYMLYGPAEDAYDAGLMKPEQRFVLAPQSLCLPGKSDRLEKSCQKLHDEYEPLKTYTDWYWPTLTLYVRKA